MDSLGEGGAEQNLLTLVRRLPPSECRHDLAWLYDDNALLEQFRPSIARLMPLHASRWLGLVQAAVRLAAHLRADPPDLIHAKLIRAQLVARLAAVLCGGIPVITTWECVSYNERMYVELGARGPWLKALTRALDAASGIPDKHFIAVSREVADYNAKKLGVDPARVSVVYNAVEPDRLAPALPETLAALRASLDLPGGPILVSVGRLVDQKNYQTAVRAMPHILAGSPHAVWLVAGAGTLEAELRGLARELRVEKRIRFLGARRDVPALLQIADLFVFSSHYEGLGIALMEALAAGLPAVASRIPTSLEVAEGVDTVRFFEATDERGLAAAVLASLAERDALRVRAREFAAGVQARFSPRAMVDGFLAVAHRAAGH